MPPLRSDASVLARSSPGRKMMVLAGELWFLKERLSCNFLFKRKGNSFYDLKISAASAFLGFQLSAVMHFVEFEPAPLVRNLFL